MRGEIRFVQDHLRPEDEMATQGDITIANGDEEMGFHCRVCHTQFKAVPATEVRRTRANGTLDAKVRLIVAEHVRDCPGAGPATDVGGKKAGRPRKG